MASALATPFVSVVVPVRNGEDTIAECVSSLLDLDYPLRCREIIVVDNDSTDRTAAVLRELDVVLVHEPRRGRARALNRGIRASHGEIIAFADADCVVDRRWLSALVAGFGDERVGAVAGEIEPYRPRTATERYVARREQGHAKFALGLDRPFAAGANVAVRRRALDRVGTFDSAFMSGQDVDFSWRLREVGGFEIAYSPDAVVHHRAPAAPARLLAQQVRYGYGRAMLRRRYDLPRGYALGRPIDLLRAVVALAAASARLAAGRGDQLDVRFAALEVLRRVGLRLGAIALALRTLG